MSATSADSVFSGVSEPTATAAVHATTDLLENCPPGLLDAQRALLLAGTALGTATILANSFPVKSGPKLLLAGVFTAVTVTGVIVSVVCTSPGETFVVAYPLVMNGLHLVGACGSLWKEVRAFRKARKEMLLPLREPPSAPLATTPSGPPPGPPRDPGHLRELDAFPAATGYAVRSSGHVRRRDTRRTVF